LKNKHAPEIRTKRVYDPPSHSDGYRILVDRLWPRGLKKENAALDEWAKELAPSDPLRKWFDHEAERWEEFSKKYQAELKAHDVLGEFIEKHKSKKLITLLYATKNSELTHAIILKRLLEKKLN
jgi:uncharacterized protein YeaO (DUF488 family)